MFENCSIEMKMLLELIRASFHQIELVEYDETCNSEILAGLIKKQQLVTLVWSVITKQADENWKKIGLLLEKFYNRSVYKSLVQQIEMQDLLDQMENRGLDVLPLKGWIMREYYAGPELRSMTDFDVLLKKFDEKDVQGWMEGLGYEPDLLDDDHHDVYIKKPYTVVELHKSLSDYKVEKELPLIDEWLEQLWAHVSLISGKKHIYQLSEEDFYIYHLIHMYKHIRISGVGIRPLIDIYVFLQKAEHRLNWKYLDKILKELGLSKFEHVMRKLSKKCFSKEEILLNENDCKLLGFFVSGGLFGGKKTGTTIKVVEAAEKNHNKKRAFVALQTMFPSAKVLDCRYPILKKYPVLLPFVWIIRAFRITFTEQHKIKTLKEGSSKEEYDKMREIFKIAGIKE